MNREWMPESPCKTCTNSGSGQDTKFCNNFCKIITPYLSAISAQKKLLKHLIQRKVILFHQERFIEVVELESMLKELEEQNG